MSLGNSLTIPTRSALVGIREGDHFYFSEPQILRWEEGGSLRLWLRLCSKESALHGGAGGVV